jgi:flagellar hook protein FlgE
MGALSAGVTGLKAHQSMLDIAGNNLANLNTIGYKASSVTFAELLSQTIKKASGPSGTLGGVNPQQMGSGVGISAIARNMSQGNIISTGQDLDVAIDGEGYFVLNDGSQDVYTRIGSFAVDADNTLVDPSTGYKVQRIGTYGETEGFQIASDNSIHIPWDASMPARATAQLTINGNLRSTTGTAGPTNEIVGNQTYTTGSGALTASSNSFMSDLDQWATALGVGDTGTFRISGVKQDGTVFTNQDVTWTGAAAGAGDTVKNVLDQITTLFDVGASPPTSVATMNSDGKFQITDAASGYSEAQITAMSYEASGGGAGADSLSSPTFFDYATIGGNDSKQFNITVFDSMGSSHVLTGTFVKTDTTNTWDLVIGSISDERSGSWAGYDIHNNLGALNRRISDIQFNNDGSYNGLLSATESLMFSVQFAANPTVTQTMTFDMGTIGEFTGLTQFASQQSSAAALSQDGYEAGALSNISIDNAGLLVGTFTNGVKVNVAALQMGVFQNPGGLEAVGGGYFLGTANSGNPVASMAATGGAGTIKGKSLEKSNVDVATEFVNMMQAQNGYQANARTIRVANDMLRELTSLIR